MKKQSVSSSIVLVIVLAISMLGFQFSTSHSVEAQETSLEVVNPLTGDRLFNFTDAEKSVGDTFIVNITVVDVTDLCGWQIKFSWDPSLLDFVSVELPSDHIFAGEAFVIGGPMIEAGCVYYGAQLQPEMDSFNGTGTLCQTTLRIIQSVSPAVPEVSCDLTFANIGSDTFLLDNQWADIPFVTMNGFYDYARDIHDVAITDVLPFGTAVGQGYSLNITVTVANQGNYLETFNVTVYANTTSFASENITLSYGDTISVVFTWDTTGFEYGSYTISAYAEPVPGETEIADNTCVALNMVEVKLSSHDIAVTDVSLDQHFIPPGFSLDIKVTVENMGTFVETFNLTVYANTTELGTETIYDLPAGTSRVLTITWDTNSFALEYYVVKANASILSDETNISNNEFVDGIVSIRDLSLGTYVYVDPEVTVVKQNETFSINVNVYNVTDLWAWQIGLDYNSTVLTVTAVANAEYVYLAPDYVLAAGFIWPDFNGSATLCRITFTAITSGTSYMDFLNPTPYPSDTFLLNHYGYDIPFYALNGEVRVTPIMHTLTITATSGGTTDPSPGSYVYNVGTYSAVTALPDAYYKLDYWELDGQNVGSTNPYSVLMDNGHTLQAVFAPIRDVAVIGVDSAKTVIGLGYCDNVTVTAQNQGYVFTESFNVTTYVNATISTVTNFTLTNDMSEAKTCVWNTNGSVYGNYTLTSVADTVPEETDTSDNTYVCSIPVHVGVPGDISGPTVGVYDGTTNMRDIQYLILLFNTNPSSPNWKPNADINNDGTVNMRDITIAILNFNKHE